MKNLENQIGQLASNLNNKPPGKLLGDNQVPRMDDGKECKVVKLRSGKELSDPYKVPQVGFKKPDGSQCMEDEIGRGTKSSSSTNSTILCSKNLLPSKAIKE